MVFLLEQKVQPKKEILFAQKAVAWWVGNYGHIPLLRKVLIEVSKAANEFLLYYKAFFRVLVDMKVCNFS